MAIIRPFAALRPAAELAAQVAALPYDVYSREEALEAVKGRPYSFLNIDRPETQFPSGYDMYAPEVYRKAGELLQRQKAEGIYVKDPAPCYYIYTLTMDGRSQTGLAACSLAEDYDNGVIRRHENTRAEKEADRIRHVEACRAQTGPVSLAYRRDESVREILEAQKQKKPLYDFTSEDQIRHQVWKISDPEVIRLLTGLFKRIPHTYIADGHHRAASAVNVCRKYSREHPEAPCDAEFRCFLSVLFSEDELKIMDYNRVVSDLNGYTPEGFLAELSAIFRITEQNHMFRPREKGEIGLCLEGSWYCLEARPERKKEDPVGCLDVSLLQREVLSPLLGIDDPKTDPRIDFVGGIRGLKELERRCRKDCAAAFSMYPTSMEELFAVADAGSLMPPKSTWFEPKLRSGLLIHEI